MKIESVFVKELSQRVEIVKTDSKKELSQKISILTSDITELNYRSWVLETFILGINNIFNYILESSHTGNIEDVNKLKIVLYKKVLQLNPELDPENLYVGLGNTLQFTKTKIKLTECPNWKVTEDPSNLMVLNIKDYFTFLESSKDVDHYIEIEHWDLCGFSIPIRRYQKKDKVVLCHGYEPKTEEDVKFFVVATCVDNFHQINHHISTNPQTSDIPWNKILYSLYDLAIRHNPFLDLKIRDFKRINKNQSTRRQSERTSSEELQTKKQTRHSLSSVPKKEIQELEKNLLSQIFGQDEAVKAITNCVKKAYMGVKNPKTPLGAFLLYGPTSTGKTELGKAVAKALTKSEQGLVKISCNTMIGEQNVHTLLGSPPGYVGYEEKGLLSKSFESSKFKVILFDEVEKASSKIFDVVLEMLEEGELLVADGSVLDFRNCLILFTSNMGQEEANKAVNFGGFSSPKTQELNKVQENTFKQKLKDSLKPEFIARLNGMFYFKPLEVDSLKKIAGTIFTQYKQRLEKKSILLEHPDNIGELILDKCQSVNKNPHARNIRNFIDIEMFEKIGDLYIQNEHKKNQETNIIISYADQNFKFEIRKQQKTIKKKK